MGSRRLDLLNYGQLDSLESDTFLFGSCVALEISGQSLLFRANAMILDRAEPISGIKWLNTAYSGGNQYVSFAISNGKTSLARLLE